MAVDLRVALQAEPLPGAKIAYAPFTLKTFGFQIVPCHRQFTQLAMVVTSRASVRHLYDIVVQRGRQLVAIAALVNQACGTRVHELQIARMTVVPAVALDASWLQTAYGIPGRDRIAFFGGVVAVIAHQAGGVFRQARRIVEQQQGMRRQTGAGMHRRTCGLSCMPAPGNATALEQAADKRGVRLVVLHREVTRRMLACCECRLDIERQAGRQDAVTLTPFLEQQLHDLQFGLVEKHARIDALVHQHQCIAQHQLIGRQAAIALTCHRFGDDAADAAQLAAIRHKLQLGRYSHELLERQPRIGCHAQDAVIDAAADGFAAADALRQQHVVIDALRIREPQPQRPVGGHQVFLQRHPLREVIVTVHGTLSHHDEVDVADSGRAVKPYLVLHVVAVDRCRFAQQKGMLAQAGVAIAAQRAAAHIFAAQYQPHVEADTRQAEQDQHLP